MFVVNDAGGAPYAALHNKTSREVTVSFVGHGQTVGLVDAQEADTFVANWHSLLATLPDMPQISRVAVTVATSVDPSPRVAENLRAMRTDDPPAVSAKIMDDIADHFSAGTQRLRTIVSVTFDPRWGDYGGAGKPERYVPEVHGNVMAISQALGRCGLSSCRPATSEELTAEVRAAFSPDQAGDAFEALRTSEGRAALQWTNAGPVQADDSRRWYAHDGHRTTRVGFEHAAP